MMHSEENTVYSELQAAEVLETITVLERRISERFPASGLRRVSVELHRQASAVETVVVRLRRPLWPLRIGAGLGILGIVGTTSGPAVLAWHTSLHVPGVSDLLQATEAAFNVIILLAMAMFFLYSLETRVKRRAVLAALHRLRSIVHIVDMHQLTKDPEHFFTPDMATSSSPTRSLTRFELVRYLDYCSELLSLASKVAALYLQHLNDAVILDAVNDIETIAASLSNKIWQKIMILDTTLPVEPVPPGSMPAPSSA